MTRAILINETTLVKKGYGKLIGIVCSAHSSGTFKVSDGLTAGVAAYSTLTSAGACAPASHALTTLTSDATAFADLETVVINTTTYRFMATPVQPYDVCRSTTAALALDNLKLAVNGTGAGDGTDYFNETPKHTTVCATTNTDTTQVFRALALGVTPNAYPSTETCAHAAFPGGTFTNGTPGVTTAAATITIGTRVYTAVLELTESFGTFATSAADEILWVTSEAVFLDNLKAAINGSGVPGTDYSSATSINADVEAGANAAATQLITARVVGTVGNAIATTTTLVNYSWTSTVLASGTLTPSRVIVNTVTLPAVTVGPLIYQFIEPISFNTGCLVTIGGTSAVLTVLVG